MATVQSLIESVKEDIGDESYTDRQILRYLNEAVYRQCASRFQLPDLSQISTVLTDITKPYISMPADYMKDLQFIDSASQKDRLAFDKSFIKFMRLWPNLDQTGAILLLSMRSPASTTLYYQPRPLAADTLTLYYFRKPLPMVLGVPVEGVSVGSPDGVPDQFQEGICASYAKWRLWTKTEQDETKANNSGIYHAEFLEAMSELEEYIGAPDREPTYVGDEMFSATRMGGIW